MKNTIELKPDKIYHIPGEVVIGSIGYLKTRPNGEVENLIAAFQAAILKQQESEKKMISNKCPNPQKDRLLKEGEHVKGSNS